MWQQIKAIREQRGEVVREMKGILNAAEQRSEDQRDLTAEERASFDALNSKAERLKIKADDLQRAYDLDRDLAEQREADPRRGEITDPTAEERDGVDVDAEKRRAFENFIRRGAVGGGDERRNITISSNGGVVGTRDFVKTLIDLQKYYAGVRQAGAQLFPTTDGNDLTVPTGDDTANTGRQVAEAGANTNITEPTLGVVTLKAYTYQSDWVKVSREMLQDNAFDVLGYINKILARRIGRKTNALFTTGTNTGEPDGFVNATVGKTTAGVAAVTYDELIDFVHSVDRAYRYNPGTALQLNDSTLAAIRKLKDTAGQYIWLAGSAGGEPEKILNYKYVINNDMATMATGAVIAAFGDWEAGYAVRDVAAVEIVRANELFIQNGLIGFNAFARMDGKRLDTKAIKTLKNA